MKDGMLYLVSTPIGNLEDITYRAVRVLREADVIAAEDTRHTRKLLNNLEIKNRLISYHEHSGREREDMLLALLREGKQVALVTDAGTPLISDPGAPIVKRAAAAGIAVVAVPGACAAIAALSLSGMDTARFLFEGFLPRDASRRRALKRLAGHDCTFVLYESPHHLKRTLEDLKEALGDREISICKELTKIHETVDRTTLKEAAQRYAQMDIKGEYVLVLAGRELEEKAVADAEIAAMLAARMEAGETGKSAVKAVAEALEVNKNRVYQVMLQEKQ